MAPDGRERVRVTSPVSPASSATAGGSSLGAAAARVRVRPVTEDELACLGQQVEESLRAEGWAEVPAHEVGLAILGPLRDLDQVAYLRFASVYRAFESAADFEAEYVGAHPNREIVLFYKPERVLIQADLLFNMPATEQYSRASEADKNLHPLLNRLWNFLLSTEGPAKPHQRVQWYVFSNGNKDRAGYSASVRKIDAWDFDSIIPCHGDVIQGNGKEVFRKIFAWHLQA